MDNIIHNRALIAEVLGPASSKAPPTVLVQNGGSTKKLTGLGSEEEGGQENLPLAVRNNRPHLNPPEAALKLM